MRNQRLKCLTTKGHKTRQTKVMANRNRETASTHYFKINTNRDKDKHDWQQENEGREGGADTHTNEDRGLEREKCTHFLFWNLLQSHAHDAHTFFHPLVMQRQEVQMNRNVRAKLKREGVMEGGWILLLVITILGATLVKWQHWLKKVCLSGMQGCNFFLSFLHIHAAVITPSI